MDYQKRFQWNEETSNTYISCWKYDNKQGDSYPNHCHSYYELSYVKKGKRVEYFKNKYYTAEEDSLFFLPPLEVHGFYNETNVDDMILQFSPIFLQINAPAVGSKTFLNLSDEGKPYINISKSGAIKKTIEKIYELCNSVEGLEEDRKLYSGEIISKNLKTSMTFIKLINLLVEDGFLIFDEENKSYSDIKNLDKVINMILAHPDRMPTLDAAAELANVSYFHFSKVFKRAMGINYMAYCNNIRIQKAEELLVQTDMPVSEIAYSVGIETNSGFTKMFKKSNGISPAEYRKKNKNMSQTK